MASAVGAVSTALVREWLKRHGHTNTLAALEVECPRGDDTISSRTELGKILGIEKQLRRNKEKEKVADGGAFQSTLEVLSDYVIRSATAKGEKAAAGNDKEAHHHTHHRHRADAKPSAHSPNGNNAPVSPPSAPAAPSTLESKPPVAAFAVKSPPADVGTPPPGNDDMQSLEVEDMDDEFGDSIEPSNSGGGGRASAPSRGGGGGSGGSWIGIQEAADLKAMVFGEGGARSTFNAAWMQGFFPSQHAGLEFGLVQTAGGPCGVLASVQAYMLRHLLFVENRFDVAGINQATFQRALFNGLADILWQAGGEKAARVALSGGHSMTGEDQDRMRSLKYKQDGLTETLSVVTCRSRAEVLDTLTAHQGDFTDRAGPGVPLVLYSAMLSRGLENIKTDVGTMEGTPRLMGQHDYCSQEMVNLLLVGRAVANAFDGDKDLDGMKLTGVHKRSNVGLLTLFEHYESMEVGSRLKDPINPVWVVCSESHFSVIFSCNADEVEAASASGGSFDLHYYDELAKQDEPIRLSVSYDLAKASDPKVILDHSKDMTPPLEHCIRTKWSHSEVSWNGTDPIL